MKTYLQLEIRAPARLAALRKANPTNWRLARECGFNDWRDYVGALCQGRTGGTSTWYTHQGPYFRRERFSNECSDAPPNVREHSGWYSDTSYGEVVRGVVAHLPHGRFIAGYLNPWGERAYFSDVYSDAREAAIQADELARARAEEDMEHSRLSDEADKLRGLIDEKRKRLAECFVLRGKPCMDYVRAEIQELREAIRAARLELRTTYKDFV